MLTVTAAIILNGDQVLVAQRSATMDNPLKWEFPGGKLEEGETPVECLHRELREELGIDVEVLQTLDPVYYPKEQPALKLLPFVVRLGESRLQPTEHAAIEFSRTWDLITYDWAEADIEIVEWCIANQRTLWSYAQ